MAERGYVDCDWVDGPYDGSTLPLPELYRGAQQIDMPDPATAGADGTSEPAIYTGPSHRYRLEAAGDGLRASFVATSG